MLAGDGEDGLVVHLGVVETVQGVDRTWTAGHQTHAQLPGVLSVGAGHESRHLLVTSLDEVEAAFGDVSGLPQSRGDAVDAIARIAVDPSHTPFSQALYHKVRNRLAHEVLLC